MDEYDLYLRSGTVHSGEWTGFALAWKGLAGIEGLPARPHALSMVWTADPSDPTLGSWGPRKWQVSLALVDGLVGLRGEPPDTPRSGAEMLEDLRLFRPLDSMTLKDIDGAEYTVRITNYKEMAVEARDARNPEGGTLAEVELSEI